MLAVFAGILYDGDKPKVWALLGIALCLFIFLSPFPGNLGIQIRTLLASSASSDYSTAVYSRDGLLLGALTNANGAWRLMQPVAKTKMLRIAVSAKGNKASAAKPNHGYERYLRTLTLLEDRKFWGHLGADTWAILRALKDNIASASITSGASTLSMQTARILYAAPKRTLPQKIRELLLAIKLELLYGKEGIMLLYANSAPFGGNVIGLESAVFRWFGRDISDATWAETAVLALLPNNPGNITLERYREALQKKRDSLLALLRDKNIIDTETYELSLLESLPDRAEPMPNLAYHYTEIMKKQYGGGSILTSLESRIQKQAVSIVERYSRQFQSMGIQNMATVILDIKTGKYVAYVGNSGLTSKVQASFVDCASAPRSSGSILKPFLYAAMLDTGELSPGRLIPDIPTRVGAYSPENMLKTYSGAVRADKALAFSLNVPFVRLLRQYGVERFGLLLRNLGFSTLTRSLDDYGLPLIVGGAEVTLTDAVRAYASLARCAMEKSSNARFSEGAAWLTLQALLKVKRPGEEALWEDFMFSRNIAWKTGTSYGNRDAWSIGVTKDYVVGVWVGNASGEGRPELVSTKTAAPVLFELFETLPRSAWFPEPYENLVAETFCSDSGFPAGQDCANTIRDYVPASAHINAVCPYCRTICLTKDGKYRTNLSLSALDEVSYQKWFVLPPAMEYYYKLVNVTYKPLPPWAPFYSMGSENPMQFVVPELNAMIYIPVELDGKPGSVVFYLVHREKDKKVFWHLDGDYLGETVEEHKLEYRPGKGVHELTAVDTDGNSLTVCFEVYSEK